MPDDPKLAAPGAGLPWWELRLGRFLFARRLQRARREDFDRVFDAERQRIRPLVEACPEPCRAERVLIRRLPGLEDSSRHWSVWMTLDHLRICHEIFTGVVAGLVEGRVPEGKADTAAVKPSPEVTATAEGAYEGSCDRFRDVTGTCPDLRSEARYAHPWFGPLDAAGWHALAAIHMEVHRKQLERIVAGLS